MESIPVSATSIVDSEPTPSPPGPTVGGSLGVGEDPVGGALVGDEFGALVGDEFGALVGDGPDAGATPVTSKVIVVRESLVMLIVMPVRVMVPP